MLSLTSAALHLGWEVLRLPDKPHVTVRRQRRLSPAQRRLAHFHFEDLSADDVHGGATSIDHTLLQCMRNLPVEEGLAIADSALRHGVTPSTLRRIAGSVRGPGSARVRRLCAEADVRAANAFESGSRGISLSVPGLRLVPQRVISEPAVWARPDLVDVDRRIVVEADSFEWHGGRQALAKDARRYNLLVVSGWIVLRFAWEDVMFDPDYVRSVLRAVVELVDRQAQVTSAALRAA